MSRDPVPVLPDYLEPGLRVVFCGTVASRHSGELGRYYAGPGNRFWSLLHESGLTADLLSRDQDARVVEFGVGLTDLGKYVASSSNAGMSGHFDAHALVSNMEELEPRWIAFNGKEAGAFVAKALKQPKRLRLGRQPWSVGDIPVFVAPSSSAANCDPAQLEGRSDKLDWFVELAELAS